MILLHRFIGSLGISIGKVVCSDAIHLSAEAVARRKAKGRSGVYFLVYTAQTFVQTVQTVAGGRLRRCRVDVSHLWEITLWHAAWFSSTCLTTHFHIHAWPGPTHEAPLCITPCPCTQVDARPVTCSWQLRGARNKILLESNGLSAAAVPLVNAPLPAPGSKAVGGRWEWGQRRAGTRMEPSAIRGSTIDYR